MVNIKMTDGSVVYTDESFAQVEHLMRGNKTGALHGFLDKAGTKPIVISTQNISYVGEVGLSSGSSVAGAVENSILYSE